MEMLNLKKQFGFKYEIGLDDIYKLERPELKDPIECYYKISAKYGLFYVYDRDTIAFMCTANRIKQKILKQFNGKVTLLIEGANESILLFNKDLFFDIAPLAKAKKRRGRKALTETEKNRLVKAGIKHRFMGKSQQHTELEKEFSPQHDIEVTI